VSNEKGCPACGPQDKWDPFAKYCDIHNVCISCGINRKDLKDTPWGTSKGAFLCAPCQVVNRKTGIKDRIKQGFEHEYTDEVVCPCCGYEHQDSFEMGDGEMKCPECDATFVMERIVSVDYSTYKKENTENQNA